MTLRTKPPFRADHVGSLLRPKKLLDARDARKQGRISAEQLTAVEDEAIRAAVKLQEDVGLQSITDGEFRRTWWHIDFLAGFNNIEEVVSLLVAKFHTHEGDMETQPSTVKVVGKVSRPKGGIFVDHFKYLKSVTKGTPKMTIPSPSLTYFRGGRKYIDEKAYPDIEEFFVDICRGYQEEIQGLYDAGCRYLQIDDTVFSFICDPKIRDALGKTHQYDPAKLPYLYARLVNTAIAKKPADMTIAMHSCRGNFQSGWLAEGGYEWVAEIMFNEVGVDAFFLEYDDERSGDFAPLRFMPKNKLTVAGIVTTKLGQLEPKDALKRRLDEAAKHVGYDNLCLSPQCGFGSTVEGNNVSEQDEINKLRLVVETAQEVWG